MPRIKVSLNLNLVMESMLISHSLAWMEMRMTFAHVFRRFDLELDPSSPKELTFTEKFLPLFAGGHIKAHMKPVSA